MEKFHLKLLSYDCFLFFSKFSRSIALCSSDITRFSLTFVKSLNDMGFLSLLWNDAPCTVPSLTITHSDICSQPRFLSALIYLDILVSTSATINIYKFIKISYIYTMIFLTKYLPVSTYPILLKKLHSFDVTLQRLKFPSSDRYISAISCM